MDRRLPSTLASLYGPHLTCQLAVSHAHLLVKIAESVLLLPNYDNLPVLVDDVIPSVSYSVYSWWTSSLVSK